MLLNAIYLYWIIQVPSRGTVMAVLYKGVPSIVVFKISPSHIKTFYYTPQRTQPPPGPPARAVRRLCVGSKSERPKFVAVTTYRCRVRFRRPSLINI